MAKLWSVVPWFGLLLWGMASVAHASPVVIVPPRADAGVGSDAVERAVSELMRVIRAQGLDPISPGQSGASAEEARDTGSFPKSMNPNECLSVECAIEFRKLFDAGFAVQLSLFAESRSADSSIQSAAGQLVRASRSAYAVARRLREAAMVWSPSRAQPYRYRSRA